MSFYRVVPRVTASEPSSGTSPGSVARASSSRQPNRRPVPALIVCGLLALATFAATGTRADTPAQEYLKAYLDLRDKYGPAGAQNEGALEVRGTVQGKLSVGQTTAWMIREDSEREAVYQFVTDHDLSNIAVGLRVRALGRGTTAPGSRVQLVAIVLDTDPPEPRPAKPATAKSGQSAPAHEITFTPQPVKPQPGSAPGAGTPSAPAAPAGQPGAAPNAGHAPTAPAGAGRRPSLPPHGGPRQSSNAPKAPAPPRWKEPGKTASSRSRAPRAAKAAPARPQALASRSWNDCLRRYASAVRWFNPRLSERQAVGISDAILRYSLHYGLDPRLIVAVIAVESDFSLTSTSNKGAMGLAQLMPGTAADLGVTNAYDPEQNIAGAVKLLRGHLDQFAGKPIAERLALALACYNAGEGAVRRHGGVPPYRETQRYIAKIAELYKRLCGIRQEARK